MEVNFFIGIVKRTESKVKDILGFLVNLLLLRCQRGTVKTFGKAIYDSRDKAQSAIGRFKVPLDVLLNRFRTASSATYTPSP